MSKTIHCSKNRPFQTKILPWCLILFVAHITARGDVPNKNITHYSRPGTVITNDPVRSYGLNKREQEILKRESVLITERVAYSSFGEAYYDIYRRDLPVYLTADSILHAVHMSFDHITMEIETEQLIPRLKIVLDAVIKNISADKTLNDEKQELLIRMLVARSLLEENLAIEIGHYEKIFNKAMEEKESENDSNKTEKESITADHWIPGLSFVMAAEIQRRLELLQDYAQDNIRNRNYSMCRPRGHYTKTPALSAYFRSLVYLGIDPFVVWTDKNDAKNHNINIGSELRSALAIAHAIRENKQAFQAYKEMEQITTAIFGQPNGITILELLETELILTKGNKELNTNELLAGISSFIENSRNNSIRFHVSPIPTVGQISGPAVKPPACISLCPRRQSFDAYAMQSVVNQNIRNRWMASHLDVALVMGSKKADELLQDEIKKHNGLKEKYAILKFQYDKEASKERDYSLGIASEWYMAIGELFREKRLAKKEHLKSFTSPSFNTRRLHSFMGAYTEYKHDLVAYSSQASLGGTLCEFPCVFIDPYPELYKRLANFSTAMANVLPDDCLDTKREFYLDCAVTFALLAQIAESEIAGIPFTKEENVFLKNLIDIHWPFGSGTVTYSGWYSQLFPKNDPTTIDMIVADIYSTPKEFVPEKHKEKVLHIGTGPINLGFFKIPGPDGKPLIYAGPVYSVFEKLSSNSKRLTDNEWKSVLLEKEQKHDYRWLMCADQKKLLSQPNWLKDIINQTNSLEMVRLCRDVPTSLSFPLRLKFTDGDKIVDTIKEASTLKGIQYLKESHSIFISPAGLIDEKELKGFISQAEKDQFSDAPYNVRKIMKPKISKLQKRDQWKYWSSCPDHFHEELVKTIINGTPDEQAMGFLSLQGSRFRWNSDRLEELNSHVLNNMPSNVIGAAKGFYAEKVKHNQTILPILKKLDLWSTTVEGSDFGEGYNWDEIIPFEKSMKMRDITGYSEWDIKKNDPYPCRHPKIVLKKSPNINIDAALTYLEKHSGFENWKHDEKRRLFHAERTCFWGGEPEWYLQEKSICFEKEMLLTLVPFKEILDSEKLVLVTDYIPTQRDEVKCYLNEYIQRPITNGSAFAVDLLLHNFSNEVNHNIPRFKQIVKTTLTEVISDQDAGYAAVIAQSSNWTEFDLLILKAFLALDNPCDNLAEVLSSKCQRKNSYRSEEPAILSELYLNYFKSNTDESFTRLKQIIENKEGKWDYGSLSIAKAIYKAVEAQQQE